MVNFQGRTAKLRGVDTSKADKRRSYNQFETFICYAKKEPPPWMNIQEKPGSPGNFQNPPHPKFKKRMPTNMIISQRSAWKSCKSMPKPLTRRHLQNQLVLCFFFRSFHWGNWVLPGFCGAKRWRTPPRFLWILVSQFWAWRFFGSQNPEWLTNALSL